MTSTSRPIATPSGDDRSAIAEDDQPLVSYAYSYPHKSSYRPLAPAMSLKDVWHDEDRSRVALYVHIPFCEMRCGFCNLFTQSQPVADQVAAYLGTLSRQMQVVQHQLPDACCSMFALGGGTPTFLTALQLEALLDTVESTFDLEFRRVPTSVETSPATATRERLAVLADRGIERISLGVQSFIESETHAFGRPQHADEVHTALQTIRALNFPVLNIDLIYGDSAQSRASWLQSLHAALSYEPEELYLYPLYVRPDTGLARVGHQAAEHRIDLYRAGRDWLLELGYEQHSLRYFRRRDSVHDQFRRTSYSCLQDGMIGLGCGARSYTRELHYATRFAVTQAGVRAILNEWISQSDADLGLATHGIRLTSDEQCRRFVIMSLLQTSGLSLTEYADRFRRPLNDSVLGLNELDRRGWLHEASGRLMLTDSGLENSDIVGPMLYSESVRSRLREFVQL